MCSWIKYLIDSNCKIQALFSAEDVTVIEMVFFHGLYNIDALFAAEYARLVACIGYHDYQKQEAAKGTSFGRQCIFALIQICLIYLTKLVRFFKLLAKVTLLSLSFPLHLSKNQIIINMPE